MILAPWQRAAAMGVSPWTPAAVPGCILYGGAYLEARATRGAQPTIPGAGWTGASWAGSGLGPYTHTAGATADLTQAVLTAGNRYSTSHTVSGRTAGTVTHKQGTTAGTTRSADGTYTDELTAQAAAAIWTPSNDFDGAVLVNAITNLSLSQYLPRIGAALTQAGPTAMPWRSAINGRYCIHLAGGDNMISTSPSSAWRFMHNGSAFTHIAVWRTNVFAGVVLPGMTLAALNTGSVGYAMHHANSGFVDAYIANGGGAVWSVNSRFATPNLTGVLSVIAYRYDGAGNTTCWINGTPLVRTLHGYNAGTFNAGDPNTGFRSYCDGDADSCDQVVYSSYLSDADLTQAGKYLATEWGITW